MPAADGRRPGIDSYPGLWYDGIVPGVRAWRDLVMPAAIIAVHCPLTVLSSFSAKGGMARCKVVLCTGASLRQSDLSTARRQACTPETCVGPRE
jgi:hypothetical protein